MRIYIVRHAIAEEIARGGGGDAKRALTPEGKKKMKDAAAGLAASEPEIETIFSSPLVRAWQTAEIVAEALKLKHPVQRMDELAPGHQPSEVLERLKELENVSAVALTGHEPNCGQLASYLLNSDGYVDIEFKKGSVCLIDLQRMTHGSGLLVYHLPPSLLRLMR